jgi:2-dehydro-3-deoxy-D-arabinonate dehydratase
MKIGKFRDAGHQVWAGVAVEDRVFPVQISGQYVGISPLLERGREELRRLCEEVTRGQSVARSEVVGLAPIDAQEVWGAGVTYLRSKQAREEESEQAASFYDQVYAADRPELFFKATPHRVVGPGQPIRVRADSRWTVPEPELALVLRSDLTLAGFTLGNDVSARDIEGRNPLYLPQAKVYDACCALGPHVVLAEDVGPVEKIEIRLTIERQGHAVVRGSTSIAHMKRRLDDLVDWLGRDNSFPTGVILLTGTGIVPPDEFTLQAGDLVEIEATGIGVLRNPVVVGGA